MDCNFTIIKTCELKNSTFRSRILDFGDFDISDYTFSAVYKTGFDQVISEQELTAIGNILTVPLEAIEGASNRAKVEVWMLRDGGFKDKVIVFDVVISTTGCPSDASITEGVSVTFGGLKVPVVITQAVYMNVTDEQLAVIAQPALDAAALANQAAENADTAAGLATDATVEAVNATGQAIAATAQAENAADNANEAAEAANAASENALTGINGTATESNAPNMGAGFSRYIVTSPITTGSAWGIEVTQAELDDNWVFFNVKDGVITKDSKPNLSGKSAYELAVDAGFSGTEAEWLESLNGEIDYSDLADLNLIEETTVNTDQIKPYPFIKFVGSDAVDSRTKEWWYVGKSTKAVNTVAVALSSVFDNSVPLTDSVYVRIGFNGVFIYSAEITLVQMAAQGIDTQAGTVEKSMFKIKVPEFTINNADIIYIGLTCKSPTDKLGFVATNVLSDEWENGYNNYSNVLVNDYVSPPSPPANGAWGGVNYFTFENTTYAAKTPEVVKSYFDKQLNRNIIGELLSKLRAKVDATLVVYGDSIVQFQNSGTLSASDQKINPIGLSGDSWVRRLWASLKYYGDDTQYRRFDHSDFTFSNNIQTTAAAIGSNGWATNRNDGDGWRQIDGNTAFAQSIISTSSYSKPAVGTNKVNEQFSINIPSGATYVEIVFLRTSLNSNIEIKINNGTSDVVSQNTPLNTTNQLPTEQTVRFDFTSGTAKTLTVKNTGGGALWIWGVVYGSTPKVRVINSGSGGYNVSLLEQDYLFNSQVKFYNPELVVYECNILNDKFLSLTLAEHQEKIKSLFNKLKALNVPVIVMLTHRGVNAYKIDRTAHSEAVQNSIEFLPELIKNYKAEAHSNGFAIIDIWAKSIDLLGTTDAGNGTSLFLDDAHLNADGNTMYSEELQKLFINEDN